MMAKTRRDMILGYYICKFLLQRQVMSRGICLYDLKQSVGSEQAWDARSPANPGEAGLRSSA